MKVYHQRPGTLLWESKQEWGKVSFPAYLKRWQLRASPKKWQRQRSGQHHRNCQEEKVFVCRRKQIDSRVGDSGSDYMLDIMSLTSLHLGLLERHREGGLSSFSCGLSHVGTSLGTSFTLPRGLTKSHYSQDSDIPPWEDRLEIPEAVSHCFCCEYVMSFEFVEE